MKIKVPGLDRLSNAGGGSTFIKNLNKSKDYQLVSDGDYDLLLIAGATLTDRETVIQAEKDGKPIILRVDNILEDSKNRNTGMPRLEEFADRASVIVYQSEWAKRLLTPICGEGMVIHNGVDTDIFYPAEKKPEKIRIVYSKHSRNEIKRFHEVQYFWREYNIDKRGDELVTIGRFAREYFSVNNPFEFHNEEKFKHEGVIDDVERLAGTLRLCNVAFLPYFADACSNTVLECQACGLPVLYCEYGGTREIVRHGGAIDWSKTALQMVEDVKDKEFDFESFKIEFGLDVMNNKYYKLFELLIHE